MYRWPRVNRRRLIGAFVAAALLFVPVLPFSTLAESPSTTDQLPSWNDGKAKQAIIDFVKATTDSSIVPPEKRIATFDQDGTLWVEHPMYTQVIYCLERVPALVKAKPELANVEPFKSVMSFLSGDRAAVEKLSLPDLEKIAAATLTGMTVDEFQAEADKWITSAKDQRWKRPYTDLVYQPMLEVLSYLRANNFKTYIVTGGGQDFVRVYSNRVYGIPPERVVGTAGGTTFSYDQNGKPILTKDPRLLLNDNFAGKPPKGSTS